MLKYLSSLFRARSTRKALPGEEPRREEPGFPNPVVVANAGPKVPEQFAAGQLGAVDDQMLKKSLAEALDFRELLPASSRSEAVSVPARLPIVVDQPVIGNARPGAPDISSDSLVAAATVDLPAEETQAEWNRLETSSSDEIEVPGGRPAVTKKPDVAQPLFAQAEDVVAAYKLFLGRFPESIDVVQLRVGLPVDRILYEFMVSPEFLSKEANTAQVLGLAKRLIREQEEQSEVGLER